MKTKGKIWGNRKKGGYLMIVYPSGWDTVKTYKLTFDPAQATITPRLPFGLEYKNDYYSVDVVIKRTVDILSN